MNILHSALSSCPDQVRWFEIMRIIMKFKYLYVTLLIPSFVLASTDNQCLLDIYNDSDEQIDSNVLETKIDEQYQCIKTQCEAKILEELQAETEAVDTDDEEEEEKTEEMDEESSQDEQSEEKNITVPEERLEKCIERSYQSIADAEKKQTIKKIDDLKKNLSSSADLELLIDLLKINEQKITDIKDLLYKNLDLWNEKILKEMLSEDIYQKEELIKYLLKFEYLYIDQSLAFKKLLELGETKEISDYILNKHKLTPAILKLPSSTEMSKLILTEVNSTLFSKAYLTHIKENILESEDVQVLFISKIKTEPSEVLKQSTIEVFKDSYKKTSFWHFYIILKNNPTKDQFQGVVLNNLRLELREIINYFYVADFKKVNTILNILQKGDISLYQIELFDIVERSYQNISYNTEILSHFMISMDIIDKKTLTSFLNHADIDYDNQINLFNISDLAKKIFDKDGYFEYIKEKFVKYSKSDLLVLAAYTVNLEKFKEILKLTDENNLDLLSLVNTDLIENMQTWVEYTKECVENKCSKFSKLISISEIEIYKAIFTNCSIPQGMQAIAKITSSSAEIVFNLSEYEELINILESREDSSQIKLLINQLNKNLNKSQERLSKVLEEKLHDDMSLENISFLIKDLKIGIQLVRELDKEKLTSLIKGIENIIKESTQKIKGSSLREVYDLIELQKIAIKRGFITQTDDYTIFDALNNLYHKRDANWASNIIKEKLEIYNTSVIDITDQNQAIYEGVLLKYALSNLSTKTINEFSFEQIDSLGKMITFYSELPRKIQYNSPELDFEEIVKEYFNSFNNYFATAKNTQVNIPITCETGDMCIFDLKYDKNIGPMTTINTDIITASYQATGLKIYKNRDITLYGSLNDVLYINTSVNSEAIPDQRPQADNGIHPVIEIRPRSERKCVIRIKLLFGNKCIKKMTFHYRDQHLITRGYAPRDGLKGFQGANSSKLSLKLYKSKMSEFGKIIVLNNTGKGGAGQKGGIWDPKPVIGQARSASSGGESDISFANIGFGFGGKGKSKIVGMSEAIPDYKELGLDGAHGDTGEFGVIEKYKDTALFPLVTIGKKPQ